MRIWAIGLHLRSGRRLRALGFELLERRTLLSVAGILPANWQAQPACDVHLLNTSDSGGSVSPYGLTPDQVRGAYGLGTYTSGVLSNGISFGGINGDGTGQTIAIVAAYDDPNALSDLNAFSTNFGLPTVGGVGGPTFTKLNQTGGTTLPGTDPRGPWSGSGADTGRWKNRSTSNGRTSSRPWPTSFFSKRPIPAEGSTRRYRPPLARPA